MRLATPFLHGSSVSAVTISRCRAPPLLRRLSQFELRKWFEALAEGPLPLFLYNMPSCCQTAIGLDTLRFLRTMPNIVGLKDSSGDAAYVSSVVSLLKDAGDTRTPGLVVAAAATLRRC